jgi:hypothetical protein
LLVASRAATVSPSRLLVVVCPCFAMVYPKSFPDLSGTIGASSELGFGEA